MKATIKMLKANADLYADEKLKLRRSYVIKIDVFPCHSFNIERQSVSFPHIDEENLPQSWCSITPLGTFDSKKGDHIVL